MRAIGLIGYHNSGKTCIGIKIAEVLKSRGYSVSAVKHIHRDVAFTDKDTALYSEHCTKVIGLTREEIHTIDRKTTNLQQILLSLQTDFVIIEGFKDAATFPKIICDTEGEQLHHRLALTHVEKGGMDDKNISQLCDEIEKKAFFLAGADCTECGYSTCSEYADAILHGKTAQSECLSLPKDIRVSIDGAEIPLKSYVSNTLKGTILGFLKNLKGYKKGLFISPYWKRI